MKKLFLSFALFSAVHLFSQNSAGGGTDCSNAPFMDCNVTYSVQSNGTGILNTICPSNSDFPNPGKETFYKFTAPSNGIFTLNITVPGTTGGNAMAYFYQEAIANLECGVDGWKCIGATAVPTTLSLGPLEAGKTYFIMSDATTTLPTIQNIQITGCGALNDKGKNAFLLPLNGACSTTYSNIYGTKDEGEPDPDIDPSDGYPGRWLVSIKKTVWFKFIAPASGTVTIDVKAFEANKVFDSRIALYQVGDSSNYTTYRLLESDDNEVSPIGINFNTFNASIPYIGLTPGSVYYIQVDGNTTGTDADSPFFCITVKNCVRRTNVSQCAIPYFQPKVNGLLPGGNHWYGIYTQPGTGDLGELAAGIWPNTQNLDTVFCRIRVYNTIVAAPNGVKYMPSYVQLSSKNPDTLAVKVRLFFTLAEFDSLKLKTGQSGANIGDLNVTHFNGNAGNEDCTPNNNAYNGGTFSLITAIDTIRMACTNAFYLNFNAANLGEFGAHLGLIPLPLELKQFTGTVLEQSNLLRWVTATEQHVAWHTVERSADNSSNWTVVGRVPAKNNTSDQAYQLSDMHPISTAYYRLRSVDSDGAEHIAPSLLLTRNDQRFGIVNVYPNPTSADAVVQVEMPQEGIIRVIVSDYSGKTVIKQSLDLAKGIHNLPLPLHTVQAGIYTVTIFNGVESAMPVRIIKY